MLSNDSKNYTSCALHFKMVNITSIMPHDFVLHKIFGLLLNELNFGA